MNNPNKNSSAWILCPSRSMAGKFYYFNVTTGEAVWSSNVSQAKLKNYSNVQKVMNKSHPDIIPKSPSLASPSTSNCFKMPYTNQNMCAMPNFGQIIFPNYLTNASTPFICTPVPMIMTNFDTKRMLNQDMLRNDSEILVKTCKITLSNRFTLIKSGKDFESSKKSTTSSPILIKPTFTNEERELKGPVFKKFKLPENSGNDKKKVDTSTQYDLENMEKKLDKCDLRYILLKRKKVKQVQLKPTKKRVSFSFDIDDGNSSIDKEDIVNDDLPYIISIKLLKRLSKFSPDNEWYIIVDQDVLMADFDFIMNFISADDNCKLLIPNSILKHIKLLAVGEHGGRQNVIVARQVYRRLTSCSERVLIFEMEEEATEVKLLINCAVTTANENYHVVLITNNIELFKTAKNRGIHVYKLDDVKNDQEKMNKAREITIVPNKQNIFLQKKDDIDPFALSKTIKASKNFKNITDAIPTADNDLNPAASNDTKNLDFHDIMNMKRVVNNTCNIKMAEGLFLNSKIPETKSCKQLFTHNTEEKQKMLLNNKEVNNFNIKKVISNGKSELNNSNVGISNKENFGNISIPLKTTETITNEVKTTKLAETDNNKNQIIDKLKRCNVRETSINILIRIDEYVCWYRQIMEEFMNILLQNNMSTIDLPCSLREGLECLLSLYVDFSTRKTVNILLTLWNNAEKGNNKIPPNDLMEMIRCGLSLVESFKNIIPDDAKEINDLFRILVDNIDNPIIEDLDKSQTPVGTSEDNRQMYRCNFIKNRSDIIEYLKKHYVGWKKFKDFDENTTKELSQNITILRTSGKNLNTVKIDSQKRISFDNFLNKNAVVAQADAENDDLDIPVLHENTFDDNNDRDGPKVIRNVKLIDEFEKKLANSNNDNPKSEYNKFLDRYNDDDDETNNDDSGFENDSVKTCVFLRMFLGELSSTFMSIYNFTQKCYIELQRENMKEEARECLYGRVKETHSQMSHIINNLKSIIQRETENTTINSIVRKAGEDMAQDLRLMRYKQTLTKCLEQARILDNCLKLILSSNKNDDGTITSVEVTYYNIFEF